VTISSVISGATIRYTTDGNVPSATIGTVYTGPVSVSASEILQAFILVNGVSDSTVASAIYTINLPQVATPTFSPGSNEFYTSAQTVTISTTSNGASIRYTTDGSNPSETHGTLYSGPVTALNITLLAIAYQNGVADSTVSGGSYILQHATPTFSPAGGTYTSGQTVTITSTTSGSFFRYTTDGSTPSDDNHGDVNGTLYSDPIHIGNNTIVQAYALGNNVEPSFVTTATYTINLPTQVAAPTFSSAAGTYSSAQNVTITSATSGASLRYTLDGSIPTETWGTLYSGPVSISSSVILKAIAYEAGFADSNITSSIYTIGSQVPVPIINVLTYFPKAAGLIIQGSDGNFYGTTSFGGINNVGSVFKVTPAGVFTTLVSFTGANGASPGGLMQGSDGNFYGTTEYGGNSYDPSFISSGYGTVFKVTPAGALTTLVLFTGANGANPFGLVQGNDGNIYGMTRDGGNSYDPSTEYSGYGTVFKVTPTGALTILVLFTGANGINPGALMQGSDGNFYGTTAYGGNSFDPSLGHSGHGTVFRVTPTGALTTLVLFTGANGANPGALMQGSNGNFYGTTYSGGSSNDGTVFMMTPAGVLTSLGSFTGSNGINPYAGLIQGSDGNFYGTTPNGGSSNDGTVFMMTLDGVLTTLVSFNGTNGAFPSGLVQGSNGNFYGTTASGGIHDPGPGDPNGNNLTFGTIFMMTPAGVLTTLVLFNGTSDGYQPEALVQGSDGNFYGTTATGQSGSASRFGVFYQLIMPAATAPTFSPSGGTYTSVQSVTISSTTSGASIRYTLDGSTPTETNGVLYSGSANISSTATFMAIAYGNGFANSTVTTATYTINLPTQVAAPTFSSAAGTYSSAQNVTITSATSSASLRYTLDGSAPTETNGAIYSGPVDINTTTTLKAIAYESGFTDSTVASTVYTIQAGTDWDLVGAADFNGDGHSDLIWQNKVTGQRAIWLMNGTTLVSNLVIATISTDWDLVGAADFNGDGQPDLIWQNTVTGQRAIWLMNGTTPVSSVTLLTISTDWDLVGAADFNGDGQPDLIWQNTVTGQRAIWLMNGTTPVSSATIATISTDWSLVGTASFNGDGQPDLIWQNTVSGQRAIWLMNGTTPVSSATLGAISTDWNLVGAADFTGNGKPDLIWLNTVTGQHAFWLMNGITPVSSVN